MQHFVFEYLTVNNPPIKAPNLYCKMIYQLLIDFLENKLEISKNLKGKSCKIINEILVNKEKKILT